VSQGIDIAAIDGTTPAEAEAALAPLFEGAPAFLGRVVAARPFGSWARLFEQARAVAHDAREVARRVDDRVPFPSEQPVEPAVAIAADARQLRVQVGARRAAVEERHLVAALERCVDDRAADELRATEEQESHTSSATPASRRSTSSAVL